MISRFISRIDRISFSNLLMKHDQKVVCRPDNTAPSCDRPSAASILAVSPPLLISQNRLNPNFSADFLINCKSCCIIAVSTWIRFELDLANLQMSLFIGCEIFDLGFYDRCFKAIED